MKNHLTTILFLFLMNLTFAQNLKPSQFVHLNSSVNIQKKAFGSVYIVPKDSALVITSASLWSNSSNGNGSALYNNGIPVIGSFNSSTGIVFRSGSEISMYNVWKTELTYSYNIIGYLVKDE